MNASVVRLTRVSGSDADRLAAFYSMWVEDPAKYYRFPFTAPKLLSLHACAIMRNFEAVCLFGYRIYKVRCAITASA